MHSKNKSKKASPRRPPVFTGFTRACRPFCPSESGGNPTWIRWAGTPQAGPGPLRDDVSFLEGAVTGGGSSGRAEFGGPREKAPLAAAPGGALHGRPGASAPLGPRLHARLRLATWSHLLVPGTVHAPPPGFEGDSSHQEGQVSACSPRASDGLWDPACPGGPHFRSR